MNFKNIFNNASNSISLQITHLCFYEMDFPSKEELFANNFNSNIDEMLEAVHDAGRDDFCYACFSGKYLTKVDLNFKKEIYEI
jgi:amidophosphoribosyltransferase